MFLFRRRSGATHGGAPPAQPSGAGGKVLQRHQAAAMCPNLSLAPSIQFFFWLSPRPHRPQSLGCPHPGMPAAEEQVCLSLDLSVAAPSSQKRGRGWRVLWVCSRFSQLLHKLSSQGCEPAPAPHLWGKERTEGWGRVSVIHSLIPQPRVPGCLRPPERPAHLLQNILLP